MKNRLQFNRIPKLFKADDIISAGTTTHVSGREMAYQGISAYTQQRDFIPLIGEPIVARYVDQNNKKQAILAIGKATGKTNNDIYGVEYHIIDTAAMQEDIDLANENASEALELASAATKDTADYLAILKNMILSGIGLTDGTYFDNNGRWDRDPSHVGLYDPIENSNYIADAVSFRDADDKLDKAIKSNSGKIEGLSAVTEDFSGATHTIIENILTGTGLNTLEPGEYPGHDTTMYIRDAESLDNADVLLDAAISELSANTIAAINETNNNLSELSAATINLSAGTIAVDAKVDELSANTMAADEALDNKIDELSANTMAADQELADRIAELEGNKILGVSAITVDVLENGDSKVSLVINEEDDKILSQNMLGLKAKVTLDYVSADKKIYLKGKNDVVISEINADDFIKDGMLSAASVITATEADHAQYPELVVGKTYIKLLFNTDAEEPGRANPVFISAEDLVDIYTVAPESHTYMEINDYVISLNVDQENGLASYNYARNISAVTANIVSACGLNMGDQGGYPGHDETHYIKYAGSLDQADVLLDAAIWETSGLVADISNRVDELSAVTELFSAHTVEALSALSMSVDQRIESGLTIISGVVENYVEEKLSGLNFDEIYEYVDNSVETLSGALLDYIIDNEEVTAAALNDLNRRTLYFETHYTGEYIPITNYTIATGTTEEELILDGDDSINEAFGKIQKQILDNEEAVAAGLNDLNRRVNENTEAISHNTGVTALSAAVMSFSSATDNKFNIVNSLINNVSGAVVNNRTDINILSGMIGSVSAKTSGVLTINANGVEQGRYSPSANTTIDLEIIQEVTGADVLLTGYELATGTTEEELAIVATDNVNEAFGKIQKQMYDNEEVIAGALNDLDERVRALEEGGDVLALIEELSGVVEDNELVTAAALNDLNDRIRELSGNTPDMSNYYTKNEVYNKPEIDAMIGGGGADALTGITMNGSPVSVTNNVANLGTIVTAQTQLSTATTGTGNVMTNITVNNHQITKNLGMTVASSADTHNTIQQLSGATVALSGKVITGITMNSAAKTVTNGVVDLGTVVTAQTQLSTGTTQGTGNVVTSIAVNNHQITLTNGMTVASSADTHNAITAISQNLQTNYYNTANTYNQTEVNNLISGATQRKYTTASTLANLALNEFLTIVKINGNTTLSIGNSLPTLPANGVAERHVIIENTGNTDVVVTLASDSRVKLTMNDKIAIDRQGIGEFNALITYDGSAYTIYVITT